MFDTTEYVKLIIALLAILDLPGNIPMFLQQTLRFSLGGRLVAALTAGVAAGVILLTFALFGDALLTSFGITLPAFKILGGLVILLLALEMLGLRTDTLELETDDDEANPIAIGIFPLAVPLLAGPGAIATVMVYAHEKFHSDHDLIVASVIATASATIILVFSAASLAGRFIGPVSQRVMNRLLGMVVGALGVEFMLEGVAAFFPGIESIAG